MHYMHYIHYIHTCIHATCIHGCMHTCIHAYMHTSINTCIHQYIHTFIHTCKHTFIHPYSHSFIHAYIHTCIHSYIHTFIHSYIHTVIHHTFTYADISYTYYWWSFISASKNGSSGMGWQVLMSGLAYPILADSVWGDGTLVAKSRGKPSGKSSLNVEEN